MHCLSTRWYLQRFQQLYQFTASKNYQCLPLVVQYKCFYNVKFTPRIFPGKFKYDCRGVIYVALTVACQSNRYYLCEAAHELLVRLTIVTDLYVVINQNMCPWEKKKCLCYCLYANSWLISSKMWAYWKSLPKKPFITEVLDVFCQWDFRKWGL